MPVKTTSRKLRVAETRALVLQLRKAGLPFSQIAAQAGISVGYACKLANTALAEYRIGAESDAAALLALSVARLDHLLTTLWPKANAGNLGAVDRVLKIEERRARLLGLDSPLKFAPTDPSGKSEYQGGGMAVLLAMHRERQSSGDTLASPSSKEPTP